MSAMTQIVELFGTLNRSDQFFLIGKLVREMARAEIDWEEETRKIADMTGEGDWNAPYPIPEGVFTEDQLTPRGELDQ